MNSAKLAELPIKYISKWIKLDFDNNSNLKNDIQNRISSSIEADFQNALNNMRGDKGTGESFSEITLLAMAYFFSEIFSDKIKDGCYSLEMVKGFLDANNRTSYTAILEIDLKFYELKNAPLFKHCWLIVQSAWFFNSEHFGHHQHIDYVNHYILTGDKLPIAKYNFDPTYLEKKYKSVDGLKAKNLPINGFILVSQWYHGILFLICKELNLPMTHFFIQHKDNREFNPLTKTSRQLRSLAPFKIIECDIKSAFPTFLDVETGAKLKDQIYNNLMLTKGIDRGKAKILFNTVCNSGEYRSKPETISFFLDCGYTQQECEHLITLTHSPTTMFYSVMTAYESKAIKRFIFENDLRCGRLHDAVLFIDTKIKPACLEQEDNCNFGYKELNRPVYKESFGLSDKRLPYAFISSIPPGLNSINRYEFAKPEVKGMANGFIFYMDKYQYISAIFNVNDFKIDYEKFISKLKSMFSILHYLNKKPTRPDDVYAILQHIRANSQYVFNVKALYLRVAKFQYSFLLVKTKERNYSFLEKKLFKKKIDFLNALNGAEKLVNNVWNYNELYCLMRERITNDDYGYLNEVMFKGHKNNNTLVYAFVRKFNLLCTGFQREPRKQVKSEPLYNETIKRLHLKSLSLNPQQQNAYIKKGITKYERELQEWNQLINNREIAKQLFLILSDVTGEKHDLKIDINIGVQNQLKAQLIAMIDKKGSLDLQAGADDFDRQYIKKNKYEITTVSDLQNIFEIDMANSVFNHISIEDAASRGEIFFNEYLQFHEYVEVIEIIPAKAPKEVFNFPEFDFE